MELYGTLTEEEGLDEYIISHHAKKGMEKMRRG
jgi:hypothetical protein